MKFKIFGDLDCPDWLLAEVFAMSKLSVVKLRLVCSALVKSLPHSDTGGGESVDSDTLATVAKHTADARFTEEDNRALVAALGHLLVSAAKFQTEPETLSEELQQLGLPREHAAQVVKVYGDAAGQQQLAQLADSRDLRMARLLECGWSLRVMLGPPSAAVGGRSQVRFRLRLAGPGTSREQQIEAKAPRIVEFEASEQRLRLLKLETARVLALMEQIGS